MLSSEILSVVTFVYGFGFLLYILHLIFKKDTLSTVGDVVVTIGCVTHFTAIILRWVESYRHGWGHVPLSNFYESLIFFSFLMSLTYLIFRFSTGRKFLGAFLIPLPLLTIGYASLSPDVERAIRPLVPALQSNWLTIHVLTCFIAYAAYAFSFVVAIIYLVRKEGKRSVLPTREVLDEFVYRGIIAGTPLLTMGIITGSAWAHYAWGSYWSWDPKETWSLITWIVYALFLHLRLNGNWRGTKSAVLSIVGFFAVIFTFLGVNFILAGLHSYM